MGLRAWWRKHFGKPEWDRAYGDVVPTPVLPPPSKPEPTRIEDGKINFPGDLVFDPEDFKKFRADHPQYSQPGVAKFTVRAHPAVGHGGVPAVGISLHGAPDPGPPQGLVDYLTQKDEDGD